jgi:DNA helicase-2/ATP-dependent DNA helicase PcrA
VLAYARAVQDPLASVELARILMGPRYRVGYKDLAVVASLAKRESRRLRDEDEEEGEATPYLFAEALERLDEIEGISPEGRERLVEFRDELRALRVEARRPVGEFLGEIIRRTGILTELDADTDPASAQATKRNLARSSTPCTPSSRSRASSRCARSSTTSTPCCGWTRRTGRRCSPATRTR